MPPNGRWDLIRRLKVKHNVPQLRLRNALPNLMRLFTVSSVCPRRLYLEHINDWHIANVTSYYILDVIWVSWSEPCCCDSLPHLPDASSCN